MWLAQVKTSTTSFAINIIHICADVSFHIVFMLYLQCIVDSYEDIWKHP